MKVRFGEWIEGVAKAFWPPKRKRIELRLVSYGQADELLANGWSIASEEDHNRLIGFVYLELLEPDSAKEILKSK